MIDAYERDSGAKNPYSLEIKGVFTTEPLVIRLINLGLTEMQMCARFEEEEACKGNSGCLTQGGWAEGNP